MLILLKLTIAHLITDFVIQPKRWVEDKKKAKYKSIFLYFHVLLTGGVAYIILGEPYRWEVPVFITVSHLLIDLWKIYKGDSLLYFLIDQGLHFIVIVLCYLYLTEDLDIAQNCLHSIFSNQKILLIVIAYMLIIWPAGFVIEKATAKWRKEIEGLTPEKDSLNDAGKWIGIFERVLVLTFILANQYSAIGFLIAAKSILRISDKNNEIQRKQTEYVLLGTLLSFMIAILTGISISMQLK